MEGDDLMDYYNGGPPPPYTPQYPPQYMPQYPPAYTGYFPPQPNPWPGPIRRNANIACLSLMLVVLLGVFVMPVFTSLSNLITVNLDILSPEIISVFDMTSELIVYSIMFAVPIAIMKLWVGIPSQVAFPMRRPRANIALPSVFICLGVSLAGMFLYSIITYIMLALFGVEPFMPESPLPVGIPAAAVYFIRLTVAPAIFEELMFRGVIMQSLRRFGDMFALVCSSILFSLAHHNLVQGPNALLIGLAIGFFVLRTGSLRTGMIIHFVNNTFAVIADALSRTLPTQQTEILSTFVFSFYTITSLICLVFLLITQPGMFQLAPSAYPLAEKRKYSVFFRAAAPIIYIIAVTILTCFQFR